MNSETVVFVGGSLDGQAKVMRHPLPSVYHIPVYNDRAPIKHPDKVEYLTEQYNLFAYGMRKIYISDSLELQKALDDLLQSYTERKEYENKIQARIKDVFSRHTGR